MNQNKVVFITGAARGLGNETLKLFKRKGYNVFATARNIPSEYSSDEQVLWHSLDITNYEDCKKAMNLCKNKFGKIDVLINNASSCIGGESISKITKKQIDIEIDTTLKGALYLSQLYVSIMSRHKSGKIIFISSTSGLLGEPHNEYYSFYAASKSALIRFSECLNQDISQYNMQSHVIVPCNIRKDKLIEQNAISYNDVSKLLLQISEGGDNIAISRVILQPSTTIK